ncbi:MAG: peptidoglycan-binding protein [bacterium]
METLKVGSRGDSVKTLQSLLIDNGYNLQIDGIFGENTEDTVMDFQKSNSMAVDGIVGPNTWTALLKNTSKDIPDEINNVSYVLTTKNYFPRIHKKTNIVLHHTAGWVVQKGTKDTPSMSHFNWWASQDRRVSTAFSIDYKGNIYQHFDPKYWAYHLGIGGSKKFLDYQSIGIEITNEGYMKKKSDEFVWLLAPEIKYNRPQDEPVYIENGWRGYKYFAPYSKEQIDSTVWLLNYLCEKFDIEKNFIDNCDYQSHIRDGKYKGIYNHANVRTDKWDLSPAFPFKEVQQKLK